MKRYVCYFSLAVVALLATATLISHSATAQQITGVNTPPGGGQVLNLGTQGNIYMTIDASGRVGIGTATPQAALDVYSGGLAVRNSTSPPIGVPGMWLTYDGTNSHVYSLNQNVAWKGLYLDGSPIVLNSSSGGNVGIGTTTPQAALDVHGGIRAGSASTGGGCSPEGAMAYDFGAHQPVYCNGSAWTSFSAATAHMFQGDYIVATGGLNACTQGNAFTGGCSCPPGSSATGGMSGMNFHNAPWDTILTHFTCYK